MDDFSPAPFGRRATRTGRGRGRGPSAAARRARIAGALSVAAVVAGPAAAVPAGATTAPPAWCAERGPLTVRTMPNTIDIAECDLRGRVVTGAGGLTATVPRDGTSVLAHSMRTDGAAELRIEVDDRDRQIVISTRGVRTPEGRPSEFQAPQDACRDGRYRAQPSKWPKGSTVAWRYHPGGTGRSNATIAEGVSNVFDAYTDCRSDRQFNPLPNVYQRYAGSSTRPPNLTDAAACGRRDGVNTFGWLAMGAAEGNVLAATCSWSVGPTTVETDMALQTRGRDWWSGGGTCPRGAYATTAVATHEAGHVLGLSHVEGLGHSNLTMAPSVGPCDNGPSTLGKGDYDGLIALYGAR
ncbi:matrixin family metalloprotease [Actinomadura sp. LOL_011]|uniref:matrixin family metalloprotease n=1 Tax=Actinomadura sp. LOL_011 TaxID=3345410 RepID=UPI003A80E95F